MTLSAESVNAVIVLKKASNQFSAKKDKQTHENKNKKQKNFVT